MKTYKVIFLYDIGGVGVQRVQARDQMTARKYVEAQPGVKRIISSLIVHDKPSLIVHDKPSKTSNNGSNSESDVTDSSGVGSLILLGIGVVLFASTLPWSSMVVGGAVGTWASQLLTGTKLEDALDEDKNKTAAFILIAALTLGGFGFVKGAEFKNEYNSPATPELNIKK